jgi:hypothetical protein
MGVVPGLIMAGLPDAFPGPPKPGTGALEILSIALIGKSAAASDKRTKLGFSMVLLLLNEVWAARASVVSARTAAIAGSASADDWGWSRFSPFTNSLVS